MSYFIVAAFAFIRSMIGVDLDQKRVLRFSYVSPSESCGSRGVDQKLVPCTFPAPSGIEGPDARS
jgi:hypothetical protein